ncbi:MAG: hypothetical protein CBD62_01605 [Candidatus Pelagibacter sp. TMED202]|jgi:hypothetical protein|nr:MAG: hypothetical protein CBD62_01605 [Candidatus Pelagibacter sp. TMED202]|tara:strand:+ start:8488 stop:9285 length:798 start_codon:yes stop_codon:yes gene_type:complete
MLSIEEIKLLIEKLEKAKGTDFQELIDKNLKILKDIEIAVDANNELEIDKIDKPRDWYAKDLEFKKQKPNVDDHLYKRICTKIYQFNKESLYNSLEIGPGNGMFSKEFRGWTTNYFLDVLPEIKDKVFRRFNPLHRKHLRFHLTTKTDCSDIPNGSCNFVFSWDTFVFFSQLHIREYLRDLKRVLIPGGYGFIQYADCHYDYDLAMAKRNYWNYNTKTKMVGMLKATGYEVVETNQFEQGANYVIFKLPGKQNPIVYNINEINLD